MSVIYLTLSISVLVALVFFAVYIHSVKRGQYDDMYTPSVRMLFDDELVKEDENKSQTEITTINTENLN
ncbi:MAG: cbb3-type cytochrome oxidase assembly protein CcoS [Flavobacteriaceae bacterium]|nr:cbb3-type cytochrome oxidase assembly protein CcoS [Flavobacteriaceae bacterium]